VQRCKLYESEIAKDSFIPLLVLEKLAMEATLKTHTSISLFF
jgi:hypothetical protein